MVLDNVPGGAYPVIISCAASDADIFSHSDLNVADIIRIPYRLKHHIGETQRQEVLHSFLAEIMVNTEYRVWVEHFRHNAVEFPRTRQVAPERLFNNNAPPCVAGRPGKP